MYQEMFFLVNEDNTILHRVAASSIKQAEKLFISQGWVSGEVISEADYINELELNQLEMQTAE